MFPLYLVGVVVVLALNGAVGEEVTKDAEKASTIVVIRNASSVDDFAGDVFEDIERDVCGA